MLENIEIKKAKLSGGLFLEASYEVHNRVEKTSKDITEKDETPVHEDLANSFKALHKHLPILCDYLKANKIKIEKFGEVKADFDWVADFEVTGFTVSGTDEHAGAVLIGNKKLKDNKQVNLVTPFVKFDDSDFYQFGTELAADIEACIYEVKEYLFKGKKAPKQQLTIDFDEDVTGVTLSVSAEEEL
jgi:hypothetical protein